jgi:hypothetical protein
MVARAINQGLYTPETATRTWSYGKVDNVTVNGTYRGYEHNTSNTANYWALKESGSRLPVRPMHWAKSEWVSCRGVMTFTDTRPGQPSAVYDGPYDISAFMGNPGDFTSPTTEEWASLQARAEANVLQKIKDQKVNLAQMFAERKKTANLIANTARTLATSFTRVKRGDLLGAADALGVHLKKSVRKAHAKGVSNRESSANAWLALQYGWQPLIQDVYGSAEALAKAHSEKKLYRSVKSTVRAQKKVNLAFADSSTTKSQENLTDYSVTVGCTFQYSNPGLNDAASLGLTNPAHLGWELLPFSFVFDWFCPVGQSLSNLDATLGCTFVDGYVAKIIEQKVETVVKGKGTIATFPGGYVQTYVGRLRGRKWRKQFDLTSLSGFPSATYPRFKNPVSTSHVANALALLQKVFGR